VSRAAHFHPQLGPAGEDTPHQNPPIGFVFSNLAQSPSPWALEWAVGFVFTSCRRSAGKPHPTRVALALLPFGVVAHHQPAVGFVFSTLPNGLCPGQSNNPLASFFQAAGLHPKWLRCAKTPLLQIWFRKKRLLFALFARIRESRWLRCAKTPLLRSLEPNLPMQLNQSRRRIPSQQ